MKHVYRVLILFTIFVGSLFYFGSNMAEAVFNIEKETMDMSDASLPYISFRVDDKEYNLLHGYCSGLDALTLRDSITPITTDQSFSVIITENESVVKKVKYEISSLTGNNVIEEGTINALDKEGDKKLARIKLKESLERDTEYVAKITLITDQSKRVYYYTRLKVLKNGYVSEKLDFVQDFHTSILNKETAEKVSMYLETNKNLDTSSFAYVNIHSSLDMVSYGALTKSVVFEQIPTITEISNEQTSVALSFVLKVDTGNGTEYYNVKENYRFSYTTNRVYLYNYERTMEAIFDVNLTSLSKSQFKIGITNNPNIEFITNKDDSIVAFVWNKELYSYSLGENKIVQVFSFKQDNTDFIRDTYEKHDVKIVSMDESGNLSFIVYGYMNRGEYEGRVGIVLYTYDRVLGRIEEQMYIPINATYEVLKEEIGDFAYRNDYDVIYFSIYNTIYSYNLSSKLLKVVAENVDRDQFVFSRENKFIAYQDSSDTTKNTVIHVLELEKGTKSKIEVPADHTIEILGSIDGNIVYGVSNKEDISVRNDGTPFIPMYKIVIADYTGKILKSYEKKGIYTTNVEIEDNVIELRQAVKSNDTILGYKDISSDFILNKASTLKENITISKRVTDVMLTEYYISLTQGYTMDAIPAFDETKNTVILEDTTVRINQPAYRENLFYAYSFGNVILVSEYPGESIKMADEYVGAVIDQTGKKVWERGAKAKKAQISDITPVYVNGTMDSLQASLKMLLSYKNVNIDTSSYSKNKETIESFLSKYLKATPLNLKGISLDQALYYVSQGRPVIAFKNEEKAVVITGYDATSITIIDPSEMRTKTIGIKEAADTFEEFGNVFISYAE